MLFESLLKRRSGFSSIVLASTGFFVLAVFLRLRCVSYGLYVELYYSTVYVATLRSYVAYM